METEIIHPRTTEHQKSQKERKEEAL